MTGGNARRGGIKTRPFPFLGMAKILINRPIQSGFATYNLLTLCQLFRMLLASFQSEIVSFGFSRVMILLNYLTGKSKNVERNYLNIIISFVCLQFKIKIKIVSQIWTNNQNRQELISTWQFYTCIVYMIILYTDAFFIIKF